MQTVRSIMKSHCTFYKLIYFEIEITHYVRRDKKGNIFLDNILLGSDTWKLCS